MTNKKDNGKGKDKRDTQRKCNRRSFDCAVRKVREARSTTLRVRMTILEMSVKGL
jgi:hypothetical protein